MIDILKKTFHTRTIAKCPIVDVAAMHDLTFLELVFYDIYYSHCLMLLSSTTKRMLSIPSAKVQQIFETYKD